MGTTVVVAEKPAVGRDIARVLGATRALEGCLEGNGHVVTWAIGHLVGLAEPAQIRPEWKRWSFAQLPMLPREWPLVVHRTTRRQFDVVQRILRDPRVREVVCATDAGREGELIFRWIYQRSGCTRPVRRLWVSSLTDAAIREGFFRLRPAAALQPLADAAVGRSRADWLVGMNLSRAYGLALDEPLSVGRVQTPTLAMVVERDRLIDRFVPEEYLEVVGSFQAEAGPYQGTWFRPEVKDLAQARKLPQDGALAGRIVARVRGGEGRVASVRSEVKRLAPPLLYDLAELQRHANRLFGFTAKHTLDVAQALYERHKLLSYPRTDSRHLSTEVARTLPDVVQAISGRYPGLVAPGSGKGPLSRRFVDDGRVTDHHAIIPTTQVSDARRLSADELRLYDLVCRRLLSAWHPDFTWRASVVVTEVKSAEAVDAFRSTGSTVLAPGWKVLDPGDGRPPRSAEEHEGQPQALPATLAEQDRVRVVDARAVTKNTRPPPRFTEATLLSAMEGAGAAVDDKELSEAMKERGLGTPATRAAIIETLLAREYLVRSGRSLLSTERGGRLVDAVDARVKSPVLTGEWEARLKRLERGEGSLEGFLAEVERYVRAVVEQVPPPGSGTPRSMGTGDGRSGARVDSAQATAPADRAVVERVLTALRERDRQSTGRLCRALLGEGAGPRAHFGRLMGVLKRAGWVEEVRDVFEKDGKSIAFNRACLTDAGRLASPDAVAKLRLPAARPPRRQRRARRAEPGTRARRRHPPA